MMRYISRFRVLEWLWIAQCVSGLLALVGLAISNRIVFLVAAECLGFPVGWLLKSNQTYAILPTALQYLLSFILLTVNGGVFYGLLRLFLRKRTEKGR